MKRSGCAVAAWIVILGAAAIAATSSSSIGDFFMTFVIFAIVGLGVVGLGFAIAGSMWVGARAGDRARTWLSKDSAEKVPLSFSYRAADGNVSRRLLWDWEEKGDYVRGRDLDLPNELTFRKDRITDWHDQSWQQLKTYTPPQATRLRNPKRLP